MRLVRSFRAVGVGAPSLFHFANLFSTKFLISSKVGSSIRILIRFLEGFPFLFVNIPALIVVGFTHQAPRNLNPSFVAVIIVLI